MHIAFKLEHFTIIKTRTNRQVTIFQESARNHFREAGIVMPSYMVETVYQPFRNNSCLVCTPENDFYVNYRGQR